MNYLIVMPRLVQGSLSYYTFPLGLSYVSAALKGAGHDVSCLNLNNHDRTVAELIREAIDEQDADVVCSGGVSAHFAQVKEVFEAARAARGDVMTVVGGGLLSSEPELMMDALGTTYGVIGEGERTITELAAVLEQGGDPAVVDGLIFWDAEGNTQRTAARSPVKDLDELPRPDYAGFGIGRYLARRLPNDERHLFICDEPRELFIEGSRSCPFDCTFCYHPLGRRYRQRSLAGVIQEMQHWMEQYAVNIFTVLDELFSTRRDRVVEFCRLVKPLGVWWSVQMRVGDVDAELLQTMRDAGCYAIGYGLESGSPAVLESMNKKITVEQLERALELTYAAGIGVQGNFIFGDAAETRQTAAQTLALWLRSLRHGIWLTPIELYPGTALYEGAKQRGIITDPGEFIAQGCPLTNVSEMTPWEYQQMLLLMELLRQAFQPNPARLLGCEPAGLHQHRGEVLAITLECPHCREVTEYRNMSPGGFPRIGCRACYRRFDVPPLGAGLEWPANYDIARRYVYDTAHEEALLRFLTPGDGSWLVAQDVAIGGSEVAMSAIALLGLTLLIPKTYTLEQITRHQLPILLLDLENKAASLFRNS